MRSRSSRSLRKRVTRMASLRMTSKYSCCWSRGHSWLSKSSEKPTNVASRLRTSWPSTATDSIAHMISRVGRWLVPPNGEFALARIGGLLVRGLGRVRGVRISVVGLGPGPADWVTPAALGRLRWPRARVFLRTRYFPGIEKLLEGVTWESFD